MLRTQARGMQSYDARMLAVADRLFLEFDSLPVLTVINAIARARSTLRERERQAPPERIEALAREDLRAADPL